MSGPINRRLLGLLVAVGASLLLIALGTCTSASASTIYACQKKKGGAIRIVSAKTKCNKKTEKKISWNTQGPAGKNGTNGSNGTNGAPGSNGKEGAPGQPQSATTFNVVSDVSTETPLFTLDGVSVKLNCVTILFANFNILEATGPTGSKADAGIVVSNSEGKAPEDNQSTAKDVALSATTAALTDLATNAKAPIANVGYVSATITTSAGVVDMQAYVEVAPSPNACVASGSAFAIPTHVTA